MGVDPSASVSPAILEKIVHAGTHATSFEQASGDLRVLAECEISSARVRRATETIGHERIDERQQQVEQWQALDLPQQQQSPLTRTPKVVCMQCDGGRLQIFDRDEADAARPPEERPSDEPTPTESSGSVSESSGEGSAPESTVPSRRGYWREDKVGILQELDSEESSFDPCPSIPETFVDPRRMGDLASGVHGAKRHEVDPSGPNAGDKNAGDKNAGDEEVSDDLAAAQEEQDRLFRCGKPEVLRRQVVATRGDLTAFGPILAAAAWSLGFAAAVRKAFVADGAESNWSLWRRYFSHFTPILDFVHAISYVYAAAMAGREAMLGWRDYVVWAQWLWSGRVDDVIGAMRQRQQVLGVPSKSDADGSPRVVLAEGLRYLENHRQYMKYDEYRRAGLPITSSHIESTIKQINRRVKGSEKFWSSEGAEALLQLTADNLCDNRPLENFWANRHEKATGQRQYQSAA